MILKNQVIILTGATGGIGRHLAHQLAEQDAQLVLVASNELKLMELAGELRMRNTRVMEVLADLRSPNAAQGIIEQVLRTWGKVDILINNAGILDFTMLEQQSPARIAELMQVNTIAPMQLASSVLPYFKHVNRGHIVNIGSIFGSLAYPYYATYSASKYALRGFSQALRRELAGSGIHVTYVAPRAVRTTLNSAASIDMMHHGNMSIDEPETVASDIIIAIEERKDELYLGFPEKIFAWINSIAPSIISLGIRKQAQMARNYVNQPRIQEQS